MIGVFLTTYNRPAALARSLPQITAQAARVLVIDDGSDPSWENEEIAARAGALYLRIPENRGLACAMNIGLSYFFADARIQAISYFQDDVDVHPRTLAIMEKLQGRAFLLTGHDAGEHRAYSHMDCFGIAVTMKRSCRATHMHARVNFWRSIYPIPTNEMGTPKKKEGNGRGTGSMVDWWITQRSPRSTGRTMGRLWCVPGLVRTFLHKAEDSCWNNEARAGEDPPLTVKYLS